MPALVPPDKSVTPPTTGHAVPVAMKTAIVESRFKPVQDLLTRISGSRLVTDYFQQLVASHDHLRPLDMGLEPAQQQYDRIQNLEMRQQGDLSPSQDDVSKEWTLTGEAILYPGVVPNHGDMFKLDVGQGEWGIAAVTNASPMSIYTQTCYRIQFRVLYRMNTTVLKNMMSKVVEHKFFIMDFLRAGKNPIIVDEEHSQYRSLDRVFESMVADYMRSFFSDVNKTLIIPGQVGGAYDPFVVKAILSLLQVNDHPLMGELTKLSVDVQYAYKTTTIWDALLMVEPSYLYLASQRMGLATKTFLKDRGVFGGAYWGQFQQLVFPIDDRQDADAQFTRIMTPDFRELQDAGPPLTDIERLIINTADSVNMAFEDTVTPEVPDIPPVNENFYYVFTEAFYRNDPTGMSKLETFVWTVLNQNEIDIGKLYDFVDMSRRWNKLERYYFVPILMWLCVIAFRGPSHG